MTTKTCLWCKMEKPLTDYHNSAANKDGKNHYCKECIRARYWGKKGRQNPLPPPSILAPRICLQCGGEYTPKTVTQKYCSTECAKQYHKDRYVPIPVVPQNVPCIICSTLFVTNGRTNQKYCSDECRAEGYRRSLARKKNYRSAASPNYEKRYRSQYVYGWYHPGHTLPFYVGRGQGKRAWEEHQVGRDKAKAACERERTKDTVIKVYRDNLTVEGALLVEAVLIALFNSMGGCLSNQVAPMKRQEVPPLEN